MGVKPSVELREEERIDRLESIEEQTGNTSAALREAIDIRGDDWLIEQAKEMDVEPMEMWEMLKEKFGDGYSIVPKEEASEIAVKEEKYQMLKPGHNKPIPIEKERYWNSVLPANSPDVRVALIEGFLLDEVRKTGKDKFTESEVESIIRRAGLATDDRTIETYLKSAIGTGVLVQHPSQDPLMGRYHEQARLMALSADHFDSGFKDGEYKNEFSSISAAPEKAQDKYTLENLLYKAWGEYNRDDGRYYVSVDIWAEEVMDTIAAMLKKQASISPDSDVQLTSRDGNPSKRAVCLAIRNVIDGMIDLLGEYHHRMSDDVVAMMKSASACALACDPDWRDNWVDARAEADQCIEDPTVDEEEREKEKELMEGMDERTARRQLGVSEDAGEDEIQSAFRSKLKEVHPDVADDPDETQTKLLVSARDTLVA